MKLIRWFTVLVAIGFLSSGMPARHKESKNERQLNVVIILLDALRADRLSVYGNSRKTSTNIDSLKPHALFFERAFTQAPWTPPAVASLLTGTYSTVHWVVQGNGGIDPKTKGAEEFPEEMFSFLDPQMITIPEVFKKLGYATAVYSGNYWISPRLGYDQGVDHFVNVELKPNQTAELFQGAQQWVFKNRERPFFLYLHAFDPHNPYEPPPPFDRLYWSEPKPEKFEKIANQTFRMKWELLTKVLPGSGPQHATTKDVEYLLAMYDSEISYVDTFIGNFLRSLEQWGISDNTLIVVTSDHGDSFNEHGYFDHGSHMFNSDFHIPLILYNRKLFPQTVTVSSPVQLIDLFPTLLDIVKYPTLSQLQGISLLKPVRGMAYSEGRYLNGYKIQSEDWSLIADSELRPIGLYNLKEDKNETINKMSAEPEISVRLLQALKKQHHENLKSPYRSRRQVKQLDADTVERLRSLGYVN